MTVKTLPYSANCYIVFDQNAKAVIIDPAERGEMIYDYTKSLGLSVNAVFITHAHFDHIAGLSELLKAAERDGLSIPVYIHTADADAMASDTKNLSRPLFYSPYTYTGTLNTLDDGDTLTVGDMTFKILSLPGHTPGCGALLDEKSKKIFVGDVLFDGSIGRCDFDGGNMSKMRESLSRLMRLSNDITVYPGHGGTTTIGNERNFNPYIASL